MSGSRYAELVDDKPVLDAVCQLTQMMARCAEKPAGIENDWDILLGDNGVVPASIKCPTLIIHDRVDPLVPYAHAQWSERCIPNSATLQVHAGGHLIWFGEESEKVHHERMQFIRRCLAKSY